MGNNEKIAPVVAINNERLERWKKKLNEDHATAYLMIGVGHDHQSGRLSLIITENTKLLEIREVLKGVLKQLDDYQKTTKNKIIKM